MKILVVDVGGTHIKVLASGHAVRRQIPSSPTLTAAQMVRSVKALTADWSYDRVSIGFPGPVQHGKITAEPTHLGGGWRRYDFERAFAASPDNLVLRYQYALVLGGYDPERFRDTIADSLKHAIAGKPATVFDAFEQNRARELLDVFKRGDMDAFGKLVKRNQGYPQ